MLHSVRVWLAVFMIGLVLSGVTAFPLETELKLLLRASDSLRLVQHLPYLYAWLQRVRTALVVTNRAFPFLAYGTDWLAFAHLVLAVAFIGPWQDPLRNRWVITFGLVACLGVLPLALIAGPVRGIPLYWRLIDCSFGVFGSVPLWIVRNRVQVLDSLLHKAELDATFSPGRV